MSLTHSSCRSAFRSDLRHGLIYGPYARPRTDFPPETCSVCKGTGTYARYSMDVCNGEKVGTPAPCEFCHGEGYRPVLEFLTMAQWAELTGLCVYCGTKRGR